MLIGTSVMFLVVATLVFFAYQYQRKLIKERSETQEIQELLKSEELKSAYALLEGQDKERERIAQDLHDRMGGQLSTINMYLDLLEKEQLNPKQQELVLKVKKATDSTIEEVRNTAHDLSNSTLNYYGLSKAIEHLCVVLRDSKKIAVQFHSSVQQDIPSLIARDIYNVIQELITNTIRHAEAQEIRIELTSIEDEVNLIYEDNGKGFDSNAKKSGIGTKNIKLRVQKHNGNVVVESNERIGTSYIIEIPLNYER